jgi:hypothetical protein
VANGACAEGVAREVAALYGERPPPVAVYEEKKAYRAKRQNTGPAKRWYISCDPELLPKLTATV